MCCLGLTVLKNLIANLHFYQYLQDQRRMRRDAQPDSDTKAKDKDYDGTNLVLPSLCHADGVVQQIQRKKKSSQTIISIYLL